MVHLLFHRRFFADTGLTFTIFAAVCSFSQIYAFHRNFTLK